MGFFTKHMRIVHGLMVALLGLAGLAELPFGQKLIHSTLENHPRLDPIIGALIGCGFLLLNPKVQALIQAKTGIDLGADQARLAAEKTRLQDGQQQIDAARAKAQGAMKPPPGGKEK